MLMLMIIFCVWMDWFLIFVFFIMFFYLCMPGIYDTVAKARINYLKFKKKLFNSIGIASYQLKSTKEGSNTYIMACIALHNLHNIANTYAACKKKIKILLVFLM